jgi:TonB-linked SusC/RagA family outer membrane protein
MASPVLNLKTKSMKKNSKILVRFFASGLMMLTLILYSYSSYAQSSGLTLDEKMTSLKQVIEKVEKISGYNFLYNAQLIDVSRKVSISKKNVELRVLLNELFKGTDITYKVVDKQVVLSSKKSGIDKISDSNESGGYSLISNGDQKGFREIKGTVLDEVGRPIPGAIIMVKGTAVGTAANIDGFFTITVPEGKKFLTASFLGYSSTEFTLASSNSYKIALKPDSKRIDEVVVTGYQTISKERATGAFVKVGSETLDKKATMNILDKLEGQTSGVLFDGSGNISIRGISTLRGETKPLLVVDGFPIEGSIETINPNDIESITVLKDAAAASIWGARAANGVIVIISKKNSEKGAPKVELSSSISITGQPDLFALPVASTKSFLDAEKFLADNKWQSMPSGSNQYPITQGMDTYLKLNAGTLTQANADNAINALQGVDVRKEFGDLFLRRAIRSQYDLSVSGSGDKNSYYMSLNYDDNKSVSKGNDNNRLITNLRLTSDISKRIKVSAGLSAGIRKTLSNGISLSALSSTPQYQTILDEKGSYVAQPQSYYQSTKESLVAKGYPYSWDYNLKQEYDNKDNKSVNTDMKMNLGLNLNILEGLDLDGGFQYEWGDIKTHNLYNEGTYFVRDKANTFSTIANGKVTTNFPRGAILSETFGNYSAFTTRAQLNFNRQFNGGLHALNAIGGIELRKMINESTSLSKYGFDPQSLQFVSINSNELYPTAISGQKRNLGDPTTFLESENRFISYYGNAAYTYNQKYTLTVSARLDDSNLFGADTKYRNVPLWSAGLNWQMQKEKFLDYKFINRLNLRLTYGTNGNVDKTTSPYLIANVTKDDNDQHQYAYVMNPKNPNLRWEKTSVVNFGVDYGFFNSRVNGSLEYYNKYSTDLLGNVSLNSTYGFQSALMNTAEMSNKGFDWNLNVLIIDKAIKWNTGVNVSYNKNRVEKVEMPSATVSGYMLGSPMVGKPLGYMYSYRWAGLSAEGTPQIYNELNEKIGSKTPLLDPLALYYEGVTVPKYYGNWQNELSYKGLRLSVLVTYKLGYKFRTPTISYSSLTSYSSRNYVHEDFDSRWKQAGDEDFTDVPKIPQNSYDVNGYYDSYSSNSTKMVEDASHIRLKEIILSYEMPKFIIKPLYLRSLNVGAQVKNVGVLLFNKSGIDPEVSPVLLGGGVPLKPEITFSIKAIF